MTVVINGQVMHLASGARVADAVEAVRPGRDGRGIAVAVNGEVVPRSAWSAVELASQDEVEVLTAVAGG